MNIEDTSNLLTIDIINRTHVHSSATLQIHGVEQLLPGKMRITK